MRVCLSVLVGVMIAVVAAMVGCVPGLHFAKPSLSKTDPASLKDQGDPGQTAKGLPGSGPEDLLPTSPGPPGRQGATSYAQEKPLEAVADLSQKDEINAAALEFAKEVARVKHVKTCFSRLYREWNLFLFVEHGKKYSLEQHVWNPKLKQWEVVLRQEFPANKLDVYLNSELQDEKCTVLK